MNLSFQKLFFAIATVFSIFAILILGKTILIPLGMALLISFILFPLAKKFESWRMSKIISAFLSILAVFIVIGGVIFFFSTQIMGLSEEFSHFKEKILNVFAEVTLFVNNNLNFVPHLEKNELLDQIKSWLNNSAGSLVKQTFNSTASFATGLLATIIFTFLILIYRDGLTRAFIAFSPDDKRENVLNMLKRIQKVGQKYLGGVILLIMILGFANSIGLWIIGIDSPFLFGFLAAVMSIIPYVGTTIGASIPVFYAFMTHDSLWVPLVVAILFWAIQLIDTNIISPKVLGSSMHVNALAAILSLIIGASVWGIAGMILFLPFAAMLKVFCEEFESLRPISLLIGSQLYSGTDDNEKSRQKGLEKMKTRFLKIIKRSKK